MDSYTSPSTKPIFRASQIVWSALVILEVLLFFRFFLKLFEANRVAGFTNFVYSMSLPFVSPFLAVFRVTNVQGNIFEWTTLLAMAVYWLVAAGIIQLLVMSKTVSTPEAAKKLEKQENV
ncbi:MAG: YggT family protein [Patescibacteria group bacterium]